MTRRLDDVLVPADPRAVVLVLHGGQERSDRPVRDRHASWWRMAALAKALRPAATREQWAVHLLQYELRGWNDVGDPSPVRDARWALDELRRRMDCPIVLVGHSMGGRTACRVADDPSVLGVVGLAPWLPQHEPVAALAGRAIHVLHGTRDRWTSARWSRDFVERCEPEATQASWHALPGAGHFMFRSVRTWNGFVEDSVTRILSSSAGEKVRPDNSTEGPA